MSVRPHNTTNIVSRSDQPVRIKTSTIAAAFYIKNQIRCCACQSKSAMGNERRQQTDDE
jgi:hypothetical protein